MRRSSQLAVCLLVAFFAITAAASDVAILRNGYSIRHERREVVGAVTRLYTNTSGTSYVDIPTDEIESFEKDDTPPPVETNLAPVPTHAPVQPAPARKPAPVQNLDQLINEAGDRQLLDIDLLNSVIHAESSFNPHAVSPKGAQGLMQLMPKTASNLGVSNAFDPQANLDGGTRYLRWLLERYNFDLVKALAAYNAGPERVDRYHGVPPYYETKAYVARIIREFNRKKLAQQKAEAAARKAAARSQSASAPATSSPSRAKQSGSQAPSTGTR